MKIHFHIAKNKKAKVVADELLNLYGQIELSNAEVIVAVGGDGARNHKEGEGVGEMFLRVHYE